MPNGTLYKMAISEFHFFGFLTPKNQNFDFLKINTYRIYIPMEYIEWKYIPTFSEQNFKLISLFLAVQWSKNKLEVMTLFFESHFLAFIFVAHQNT